MAIAEEAMKTPAPEIMREMDALKAAIGDASDQLSVLVTKLKPVRSDAPRAEGEEKTAPPEPTFTAMGSELQECRHEVKSLTYRINEAIREIGL